MDALNQDKQTTIIGSMGSKTGLRGSVAPWLRGWH